jgi:hypothetical protein
MFIAGSFELVAFLMDIAKSRTNTLSVGVTGQRRKWVSNLMLDNGATICLCIF